MFQRIKDWTRSDWTNRGTSWWELWKFERFIKSDIKNFKKDAEMQAAVHQAATEANQKAFADLRGMVTETQVAEEVSKFYRGIDLGDGAGVQIFETQEEAITAIVKAQRNTNAISHNFKK